MVYTDGECKTQTEGRADCYFWWECLFDMFVTPPDPYSIRVDCVPDCELAGNCGARAPTPRPYAYPTYQPSIAPSYAPSVPPTAYPSDTPTTSRPTATPSKYPSPKPTRVPSARKDAGAGVVAAEGGLALIVVSFVAIAALAALAGFCYANRRKRDPVVGAAIPAMVVAEEDVQVATFSSEPLPPPPSPDAAALKSKLDADALERGGVLHGSGAEESKEDRSPRAPPADGGSGVVARARRASRRISGTFEALAAGAGLRPAEPPARADAMELTVLNLSGGEDSPGAYRPPAPPQRERRRSRQFDVVDRRSPRGGEGIVPIAEASEIFI